MFVPPYQVLCDVLGFNAKDGSNSGKIEIPRRLFEFLLQCMLIHADFDEESYVTENLDIRAALKTAALDDPSIHFVKWGYFEGRAGGTPRVDEDWYNSKYPDVASAIVNKEIPSAQYHYFEQGSHEWRAPNRESEADIAAWLEALGLTGNDRV